MKTKYIATNNHPSIADLQFYHELVSLHIFQLLPNDFEQNYPKINNWLNIMNNMKSTQIMLKSYLNTVKTQLEEKNIILYQFYSNLLNSQ